MIYSATGRVTQPDIGIAGVRPVAESNPRDTLDPERLRAAVSEPDGHRRRTLKPGLLERDWAHRVEQRSRDGCHGLDLARSRRAALVDGLSLRETYQLVDVDDALNRLVPPMPPR